MQASGEMFWLSLRMGTCQNKNWGSLEVPGGVPGGTKNGGGSLGASWDGPGGALECFWRYGPILGSVLRCQKVAISLVLEGFLICHVF